MGQSTSSRNDRRGCIDSHFNGPPPASLSFDPSESYMVSYGINVQTNSKFSPDMTLSAIAVDDAKHIRDILVKSEMVPESNAHLYAASENPELCKMSGIKKTFQDYARKVGPNGLFVFHFSGHGVPMKIRRKNEWGLAPVDFNFTRKTYLTADVFKEWFSEVECRAKHILFFLDCCHAGGIAKHLSQFVNLPVRGKVYVLSACTAEEETLVIRALKHSIFTYFLLHAILKLCKTLGELPLKAVFNECHTCSKAFSSLMIMYDDIGDYVIVKRMQPEITVINPRSVEAAMDVSKGRTRLESDEEIGRFEYAMELYDRSKPGLSLDEVTVSHINWWVSSEGALSELQKRQFLSGRVLEAAICSMMYSIATIELTRDRNHERVRNPNLSIIAFLQVASVLDTFVKDLAIPRPVFFMSWMFYRRVLKNSRVIMSDFHQLFKKLINDCAFNPEQRQRRPTIVPSYTPVQRSQEQSVDDANLRRVEADCDDGDDYDLSDLFPDVCRWIPITSSEIND